MQVTSDAAHGHVAYADCVGCLTGFARNTHSAPIAVESVRLMTQCTHMAIKIYASRELPSAAASSSSTRAASPVAGAALDRAGVGASGAVVGVGGVVFTDCEEHVRLWFPVLTGLGGLAADARLGPGLRGAAMDSLFAVLRQYGGAFSPALWGIVSHGVLLPLFEDVHHLDELADTSWLQAQLGPPIKAMTSLCVLFMPAVAQPLGDFLQVLGARTGWGEDVCVAVCVCVCVHIWIYACMLGVYVCSHIGARGVHWTRRGDGGDGDNGHQDADCRSRRQVFARHVDASLPDSRAGV